MKPLQRILACGLLALSLAPALDHAPAGVVAIVPATADGDHDATATAAASGVVIAADGWVLTLEEALPERPADADAPSAITVVLPGGARRDAHVVARGETTTAVLLRVDAQAGNELQPLPLADSRRVAIGDAVWTAGNSFGAIERDGAPAISRGVVSGRYVIPESSPPVRGKRGSVLSHYRGPVLETDAAVNDGNQGGALLDDAGRLIGLVSLGVAHQRKVGTAVPLARILDDLDGALPTLSGSAAPAGPDAVGRDLVQAARRVADSLVLCYVERPQGPGNPRMVPRPPPVTSNLPRYQRERLEEQWNRWYHAQQVAYTDQAVPAVIIDAEEGLLLTAASNLHGDAERGVVLEAGTDGTSRRWTVHSHHAELDLAVLACDGPLAGTRIRFASEPDLHSGDPIAVVGRHRDGGAFTMTSGVVSATDRRKNTTEYALHQTDALANYGSLGGAVIDLDGETVGLITHLGPTYAWGINSGVAVFVDSATIAQVLDDLVAGRSIERPRIVGLGIRQDQRTNAPGVAIESVIPGTGAAAADIRAGDVIRGIDERVIDDLADLKRALIRHRRGDRVTVRLLRGGEELTVTIELDFLPRGDAGSDGTDDEPGLLDFLFDEEEDEPDEE